MSTGVKTSDYATASTPARDKTFKELIEERYTLEVAQRKLNEAVIRKCIEEGWTDCLTISWGKISQRTR